MAIMHGHTRPSADVSDMEEFALRLGLHFVLAPVFWCRSVVLWLVRVSASLGVRACACRFGSVLWSGIVFCNTHARTLVWNCLL